VPRGPVGCWIPPRSGMAGAAMFPVDQARLTPRRYPLSPAQQDMWFLERLAPGTPLYNIAWTTRFAGPLDAAALRATVSGIAARHEILRTRFVEADDGLPVQSVEPSLPPQWRVPDLAGP